MKRSPLLDWEETCPCSYPPRREHSFWSGHRDLPELSDRLVITGKKAQSRIVTPVILVVENA